MIVAIAVAALLTPHVTQTSPLTRPPLQSGFTRLRVLHAEYGDPARFKGVRDVTEQVTAAVRQDTLWVRLPNAPLLGDPAPGAVKTLTVDYEFDGLSLAASARDFETLAIGDLPGPPNQIGSLHILRAQYGALDGSAGTYNVTDRIAEAAIGEGLETIVDATAMGGDPAPGVAKCVRVWYVYKGRTATATVPDGGILSIGEAVETEEHPGSLQILHAEYGASDDVGAKQDVTDLVSWFVAGNGLRIAVRPEMLAADRSLGPKRSLRVSYSYLGQTETATAKDGDVLSVGEVPPASIVVDGGSPPAESLQILHAQYGGVACAGQSRDVTALVAAAVKGDRLGIRVDGPTLGPDPSPGHVKCLTVEYSVDGLFEAASALENERLAISPRPRVGLAGTTDLAARGALRIVRAEYGAPGRPELCRDVTESLTAAARGDGIRMRVDTVVVGCEPAPSVVKVLRVLYAYRGVLRAASAGDGALLDIGAH